MNSELGEKPKKKDDSMEENITGMLEKLMEDDEEKSDDVQRTQKKKNSNQQFETPILCINNVPLEQNKNLNVNMKPNFIGTNRNKLNLLPVPDSSSTFFKKRHSFNTTVNPNEQFQNFQNFQSNYQNTQGYNSNSGSNLHEMSGYNMVPGINIISTPPQMTIPVTMNMSSFRTIENANYTSASSNNSHHSAELATKTRIKRQSEDYVNEIDELLENKVKIYEKIDEESLTNLKGNFLKIVKSQNGSRILQGVLNKTSSAILSIIFEEIKIYLPELMVDSYANYFCSKFYDFLDNSEKVDFLTQLKNHIVSIGNSTIGTYPLQAIIDQMKTKEERKIIIDAVRENVMEMSQHAQGTHVVEKMIICFEEESIKEIYDIVIDNFMFLACHPNGLCVTKKVISCAKSTSYIETLQKLILDNCVTLLANSNGNYSIQVALDSWDYDYISPIIVLFDKQLFSMSIQKFSSNIVEKCLERGGEPIMAKFLEEVCHKAKILELMKNPFGNYVIQKALKVATGYHKGKLTGIIKKHMEKLHDKKLVTKWKNIVSTPSSKNILINNLNLQNLNQDPNNSYNSNNSSHSPISNNSSYSNRSNRSNNSFNSCQSNNSFNPMMTNLGLLNNLGPVNINKLFVPNMRGAKSEANSPNSSIVYRHNSASFGVVNFSLYDNNMNSNNMNSNNMNSNNMNNNFTTNMNTNMNMNMSMNNSNFNNVQNYNPNTDYNYFNK